MHLDLTQDETKILKSTLDRAIHVTEMELVRTDAPALQHSLNRDFEQLKQLRRRLDAAKPD
jgi:hypothetical protein